MAQVRDGETLLRERDHIPAEFFLHLGQDVGILRGEKHLFIAVFRHPLPDLRHHLLHGGHLAGASESDGKIVGPADQHAQYRSSAQYRVVVFIHFRFEAGGDGGDLQRSGQIGVILGLVDDHHAGNDQRIRLISFGVPDVHGEILFHQRTGIFAKVILIGRHKFQPQPLGQRLVPGVSGKQRANSACIIDRERQELKALHVAPVQNPL